GVVLGIMHNADDLGEIVIAEKLETLADGVLIGKDLAGRGFIDDCHSRTLFAHRAVKNLTPHHGTTHGLEVLRRYQRHLGNASALTVVCGFTYTEERSAKSAKKQRQSIRKSSRLHAGRGLRCFKSTALEFTGTSRVIVQRAQIKRKHSEVVRIKSRVHLL